MTVATLADVVDIQARIAERNAAEAQAQADYVETICPSVRPLLKVADSYIDYIRNPQGRLMLGFHDIDMMMRGIGRGELCFVFGQLHQGKTQLVLNAVAHNHDKHILYYTPDEMAEEVLTKLIAIKYQVDVESLEQRIKSGDEDAIRLLKTAATKDFPYLAILDEGVPLRRVVETLRQMEGAWQADCDLLVVDFLGAIPGYEHEGAAAKAIKALAKNERLRVLCVQQGHKDAAKRGNFQGVHGMLYGGQNEATFILEVIRPSDSIIASQYDRIANQDVLSWGLWKNKRPPCKKGSGKLFLDPRYGSLETWGAQHMVRAS